MRASSPVLRYRSTAGSICIRRAALRSNFTCGSIGCGLDLYPAPQVVDRIWPLPDEGVRPASVIDDIYHSPVKRSMTIAGHQTSISLEPIFWDMLKAAAEARGLPVSALVAQIDVERLGARQPPGLATSVRLWLAADRLR